VRHNPRTMQTIYEAAGGRDGMLRLANAWHKRVLEDEVVSHAFSHGYHPEHTERLAAYWAEALGGPTTYSDQYGDETIFVLATASLIQVGPKKRGIVAGRSGISPAR
jgi:truncated hemoglobin YjbI